MAIFASLFAFVGRFLSRILTMALGWASTLLFGRVPQSKQLLLSGISLGSIAWVLALLGVIFPDVGTFMLAFVPRPQFIEERWIRLAMLVAALVIPILVGIGGLFMLDAADRPKGTGAVKQVLRGYPYAGVLALSLLFMAVIAPVRKLRSMVKRWEDAHIPVVIKPGGYERVAADLEKALDSAGLGVERRGAPRVLEAPSKLLAAVAGGGVKRLVPDRLIVFRSRNLEVLVYPSDISVAGQKGELARARAAVASRLTFTSAYLTSTKESQDVEERLERVWHAVREPNARFEELERELTAVHDDLQTLEVEYDEWEVLYRLRLQVERDLLSRKTGTSTPEPTPDAPAPDGAEPRAGAAQPGGSKAAREAEAPSLASRAVEGTIGAGFAVAGRLLDRVLAAVPIGRRAKTRGRTEPTSGNISR